MAHNLKNLPPDVRRELLRHIKPLASQKKQAPKQTKNNNTKMLLGCTAFVGCAASIPYWATQTIGNLTDRDDALTPAQVRRGAFLNTGSRDAGKDPNWDWKSGTYVYPKGFAEHLKQQSDPDETDLGPDLGPMVREEKQQRQKRYPS
jgi:hypothetical protein